MSIYNIIKWFDDKMNLLKYIFVEETIELDK